MTISNRTQNATILFLITTFRNLSPLVFLKKQHAVVVSSVRLCSVGGRPMRTDYIYSLNPAAGEAQQIATLNTSSSVTIT